MLLSRIPYFHLDGDTSGGNQGHEPPTPADVWRTATKESEWSHPLLIGGYLPLDKTYNTEPAPDTLSPEAKKHIIGVQANLWTEYIGAPELAEYQVLPRMAALAEVQWMQPEAKDFEAFKVRAKRLMKCYDALGWKYCTEAWRTDSH